MACDRPKSARTEAISDCVAANLRAWPAATSVKVSNRAYAKDVSTHLAEMGLERALRSFNADTFGAWTLSRSSCSFPKALQKFSRSSPGSYQELCSSSPEAVQELPISSDPYNLIHILWSTPYCPYQLIQISISYRPLHITGSI